MTFAFRLPIIVILSAVALVFIQACKDDDLPEAPSVIVGRAGDTCRLSRVLISQGDFLQYEYAGGKAKSVTLRTQGAQFPCELVYDANGRLQRVNGKIVDTNYEYDAQGRVTRENRVLHNDSVPTQIPHYGARVFEYNEAGQVSKCSYVEGRGTGYNSNYVEKGQVYRYETFAYDVEGDVIAMVAYEREAKSERFLVVADYAYFYDKLINPFYGHPGIFDFALYFGSSAANHPAVFSKHNIIRRVAKGFGTTTYYTYSDTKYPLLATSVPWENTFLEVLGFEYLNCR